MQSARCLLLGHIFAMKWMTFMYIIFIIQNRSLKDCLARLEFAMVLVKTRRLPGRRRPEVPSTTSGSSPPTRSSSSSAPSSRIPSPSSPPFQIVPLLSTQCDARYISSFIIFINCVTSCIINWSVDHITD